MTDTLRDIPAMTDFLTNSDFVELNNEFGDGLSKFILRQTLNDLRLGIKKGSISNIPEITEIIAQTKKQIMRFSLPEGKKAINASGILLHTGLGRAPLCSEAIEALSVCDKYSILQLDLESGKRSSREAKIEAMLKELTGCEAVTIVNNNAAATMLILNTLCAQKDVIISRGQLIEIGGSFRMPDVMLMSGSNLKEIGTTNRTHLKDYEEAINPNTGAIIHVHTSNYRIRGFSKTPDIEELALVSKKHNIPLIDDIGSGALISLSQFGIPQEPMVRDSIKKGSDVVCFSADKLICGPQAGIICGKKNIISQIKKNPFSRMFRVCKLTLYALEETLVHFINGDYRDKIPLYKMLSKEISELDVTANKIKIDLGNIPGFSLNIEDDLSYIGSGTNPDEGIKTKVLKITPLDEQPEKLAYQLRIGFPSIICRVNDESLIFDMRTVFDDEIEALMLGITNVLRKA